MDVASPDPHVRRLSDGSFYNERLRASNVWEVGLPYDLVDEAADLFYGGGGALCEMVQGQREPYSDMATAAGTFFSQKVTWNSDLLWVSADDRAAFAKFEAPSWRMLGWSLTLRVLTLTADVAFGLGLGLLSGVRVLTLTASLLAPTYRAGALPADAAARALRLRCAAQQHAEEEAEESWEAART